MTGRSDTFLNIILKLGIFIYFFIIFGFVGCAASKDNIKQGYYGPKKRIAVVGFSIHAQTYDVQGLDKKLGEMLSTALFKSGHFVLVERDEIERVFEEQRFQLSDVVDPVTAVEIGKILGAQAIVTGSITEVGFQAVSLLINLTACRVSIDIRIIDASTAKVIMAETGQGRSLTSGIFLKDAFDAIEKKDFEIWISDALRKAAQSVAKKIDLEMTSIPWTGTIAHISRGMIFINAGEDTGLRVGDKLQVIRCIRQIRDPATKEILGCEEIRIGELLIANVRERLSEAVPQNGKGSFKIGDSVKLIADNQAKEKFTGRER